MYTQVLVSTLLLYTLLCTTQCCCVYMYFNIIESMLVCIHTYCCILHTYSGTPHIVVLHITPHIVLHITPHIVLHITPHIVLHITPHIVVPCRECVMHSTECTSKNATLPKASPLPRCWEVGKSKDAK